MTWNVQLYKTPAGNVPFAKVIRALSDAAAEELAVAVEQLRAEGMALGEPRVKQLAGYQPLRELRLKAEGEQWRLVFFNPRQRLLVGVEFCNRRDLRKSLPVAQQRMTEWNARNR